MHPRLATFSSSSTQRFNLSQTLSFDLASHNEETFIYDAKQTRPLVNVSAVVKGRVTLTKMRMLDFYNKFLCFSYRVITNYNSCACSLRFHIFKD